MAITSSTVWTSKNQDLLKDPWKTSCCYRPFLLPLLPSAGSSDKTLWLWVHRAPKFGCNNLEALHARLQGFPTSGMALNTFSLCCPQTGMRFVNIRLNFFEVSKFEPERNLPPCQMSVGFLSRNLQDHWFTLEITSLCCHWRCVPQRLWKNMRLLHLLKPIKVEQASTVSVVISKIFATDFQVPPMIQTCWWKKSG